MDNSDDELTIYIDDPQNTEVIDDTMSIDISNSIDNYAFSTGATGAAGSYYISTGAGSNGTWSTNPYVFSTNNTSMGSITGTGLHVSTDAVFEGDIKWKGRSLGDMLATIEKRLAILTPDPAKLEHFEALQKAYDHYKTLEALCEVPEKKDDGS
jgi:hypothetical protein